MHWVVACVQVQAQPWEIFFSSFVRVFLGSLYYFICCSRLTHGSHFPADVRSLVFSHCSHFFAVAQQRWLASSSDGSSSVSHYTSCCACGHCRTSSSMFAPVFIQAIGLSRSMFTQFTFNLWKRTTGLCWFTLIHVFRFLSGIIN